MTATARRRPERHLLRVVKGGFQPADGITASRLRAKRLRVGDEVFCELRAPRNPKFHRLAHAFGRLVAENIEDFTGMDAHRVLKRLQLESGIGCDEVAYRIHGHMVLARIPLSISFESMDQGEFHDVFRGLCRHVAATYWRDLTPERIEEMAEVMVGE